MDLSFSDLNLQLDGLPPINFNSVETLPGFEARAALSSFLPGSAVRYATAVSFASMTSKYFFNTSHIIHNFAT